MKEKNMLSRILGLGNSAEQDAKAIADVATLQAEFDAYKATAEELLAVTDKQLTESSEALAKVVAHAESLEAKVAALEAEKATTVATAEAKRLAARKEKIVEAVGTARADALMAATEALDDTAFDAVVSALKLSVDTEAKSEMFKEVGAAAEVDAAKVTEESAEMKILKAKYKAQD